MKLGIIALSFLLAACGNEAIGTVQTNNPNFELKLLFSHDGCSVYRFWDFNEVHYYTDCRGSVTSARQTRCGKNCTRTDYYEITTVK